MPFLQIYIGIILFVLGACMGSFLTCAADRYLAKESVLKGRSHCPACGKTLTFFELIPIFGYLFLRGRCRKCGAPIPIRCLFTELLGGLVYVAVYCKFGWSFVTLEYLLLFSALLPVALIDADQMEIPDGILLFLVVVFAAFFYPHGNVKDRAESALYGSVLIGGGLFVISFLLASLLKKETLGGGDVKLFFVLALFTGLGQGLLLVIFSCIAGLLFALTRRKGREREFPFGPAIAAAALFTLLAGQELIDLYLSLIL